MSGVNPVISKILSHRWFSKHFKHKKLLDIGVSTVTQSRSPKSTFGGGDTFHITFLEFIDLTAKERGRRRVIYNMAWKANHKELVSGIVVLYNHYHIQGCYCLSLNHLRRLSLRRLTCMSSHRIQLCVPILPHINYLSLYQNHRASTQSPAHMFSKICVFALHHLALYLTTSIFPSQQFCNTLKVKKKHVNTTPQAHLNAVPQHTKNAVHNVFSNSNVILVMLYRLNTTIVFNNDGILVFEHKSRFFVTLWDADSSIGNFSYVVIFFVGSASLLLKNQLFGDNFENEVINGCWGAIQQIPDSASPRKCVNFDGGG